MKPLPDALSFLRSIFFSIPVIIVSTVALGVASVVVSLADGLASSRRRLESGCARRWARIVLGVSFVRVSASGLENIDPARNYIFCPNHVSYLDTPVIVSFLHQHARFVAKKSLFQIPVFGWAMRRAGHIPLDRQHPRAALGSFAEAAGRLREGLSIIIFPEGGRSPDGRLQPFLNGAFRLAIRTLTPIVPLAIVGTREALAPGSIHIRRGSVQMKAGAPIPTNGMTAKDRDRLAAMVRQAVEQMIAEADQQAEVARQKKQDF